MRQVTVRERANVVLWYTELRSVALVQRKFRASYNRPAPTRRTILKWAERFREDGSVANKAHDYPNTTRTEELSNFVLGVFEGQPGMSTRRAARLFDVGRSTVHRVLRSNSQFPYKVQVLHELEPEDYTRRVQFCTEELQRLEANPAHAEFILFTDEANFHLDGTVNRHNCRYWSSENPGWTFQRPVQSPKVVVWGGVWKQGVVGPFFFSGNVTGQSYLAMLQGDFLPELERLHMQREVCIFMHDGAPPHWCRAVRQWLDSTFPQRWMGRGSPNMKWPPRSPDLTPCDFFLWGHVKERVYQGTVNTVEELKDRIERALRSVDGDMLERVFLEYQRRLRLCIRIRGGHVEVQKPT